MALIGLMGTKSSGKTTSAAYLTQKYQFVERSFADCLKSVCKELFLLEPEQLYDNIQKESPDPRWFNCTPRKMLQFIGTDLLRNNLDQIMPGLGKNIFVHHFKLWYQKELSKNPKLHVVVSDVRFQNEADFIKSLGGTIIKITRFRSDDSHASETEMANIDNYDYSIDNTGSLEDLQIRLSAIVGSVL